MQKVKANCYEQAVKHVGNANVKISSEVNANEKHLYHILSVKKIHLSEQQRYKTSAKVIKFHADEFRKKKSKKGGVMSLEEALKKVGETNIFLLHDPSKPTEAPKGIKEDLDKDAGHQKDVKDSKSAPKQSNEDVNNGDDDNGQDSNEELSEFDKLTKEDKNGMHYKKVISGIENCESIEEAQKWVALKPEADSVVKAYEKKASELDNK